MRSMTDEGAVIVPDAYPDSTIREALAKSVRRPNREAHARRPTPAYRLYGAGGKPEGGW